MIVSDLICVAFGFFFFFPLSFLPLFDTDMIGFLTLVFNRRLTHLLDA